MTKPVPQAAVVTAVREALALAQRGDLQGAIARAKAMLGNDADDAMLHALIGMLACRAGDAETGVVHLRQTLALAPQDIGSRGNLVQALIELGRPDEALEYCTAEAAAADPTGRLWRLRGFLLDGAQDREGAVAAYRSAVAAAPGDHESWNNLGNALAAGGDHEGAVAALERAATLRPDLLPVAMNHAAALAEAGREEEAAARYAAVAERFPGEAAPLGELGSLLGRLHRDQEALDVLRRALARAPDDAGLNVRFGEQCVAVFDHARAEQAFLTALARDPAHAEALVQLAILYEQTNRVEELHGLLGAAQANGVEPGALAFLRALGLRRERRFAECLEALAAVPPSIEPARRMQMIGQCHDRLDEAEAAFAAFAEANRLHALDPTDPAARAAGFRRDLRQAMDLVTPGWFAGWKGADRAPSDTPAPTFLVGFPRSGTTLLDTLLMGHPQVTVMEELPPLRRVELALAPLEALPAMDEAAVAAARALYFEEVANHSDWRPGQLLVDKLPMNLIKAPLIHRLFPDARFVLALRHPCDVVLSCFITTFKLNNAMANFLDLEEAAETYDLAFRYWEQCRSILPLRCATVRYEDVVADRDATLRPLFDYLGLDWEEAALDHQSTAASRGNIATASYAQVTEPLYKRAVGRWARYRERLAPVLPRLAPWAERFGYEM